MSNIRQTYIMNGLSLSHTHKHFLLCQTTADHKVSPSLNLFQQQKWDPLDQRSTLASPADASDPKIYRWQEEVSICFIPRSQFHIINYILLLHKLQQKVLTWQLGDRKSQSLIVLSNEPEINVSSTGDMERDVTLVTTIKQRKNENTGTSNLTLHIKSSYRQTSINPVLTFCYAQESSGCICCHEGTGTG